MIAPLIAASSLLQSAAPVAAGISPREPGALALGHGGGLYVADDRRQQILERLPNGRFKVVAGNGVRGFSGDGGRATAAELDDPGGMAVARDGSLFFADSGNNRVRKISPDGRISTVAGNGKGGWTAAGLPRRSAPILSPAAVAFDSHGRLCIAAAGWGEVLRIGNSGTLTRLAGSRRRAGIYGVNGPATSSSADGVNGLAFDEAGNLYLAGFNTKTLLMIDHRGIMRLPAGETSFYPRGAGGLTRTSRGQVLAIETQNILNLTPRGWTKTYTFRGRNVSGITGFLPAGLAASGSGVVYTDTARGNGWSNGSAIVSITSGGMIRTLWQSRR